MKKATLKGRILNLNKKQVGATAIEYAVVAGLVAILLVTVLGDDGPLDNAITTAFEQVETAITGEEE